jgi:hypothetical protein
MLIPANDKQTEAMAPVGRLLPTNALVVTGVANFRGRQLLPIIS